MKIIEHVRSIIGEEKSIFAVLRYLNTYYTPNHSSGIIEWLGLDRIKDLGNVEVEEIIDYNDHQSPGGYDHGQLYRIVDHEMWVFHSPSDPEIITELSELCSTCSSFSEVQALLEALDLDDPTDIGVRIETEGRWVDDGDCEAEASTEVSFMGCSGEVKHQDGIWFHGRSGCGEMCFGNITGTGSRKVDAWMREQLESDAWEAADPHYGYDASYWYKLVATTSRR